MCDRIVACVRRNLLYFSHRHGEWLRCGGRKGAVLHLLAGLLQVCGDEWGSKVKRGVLERVGRLPGMPSPAEDGRIGRTLQTLC